MSSVDPPPLAHHFADLEQQHEAASLGMWIFLGTELMFFGGLFTAYTVYRCLYPEAFAAASRALDLWYGGVNTVVLLTSSLTMALAVHAAQTNRRRQLVGLLLATVLLGVAFLVIKGFEYYHDYEQELVPGLAFRSAWQPPSAADSAALFRQHVQLFYVLYYLMTGLHALHLIIGVGILLVLAFLARRGWFYSEYYAPVEVGGLYWHFVDIVWIFLLPLLYLIGTR